MTRTAVAFRNRDGLRLVGILERPAVPTPGAPAVLLLAPGAKMRVGPQRLYSVLSEEFVSLGLTVLRFDFHGLGDAEGVLSESLLRDVYNHIEVGRFVQDTLDAMDWVQAETGASTFVLAGLCGGAVTGLLTGARDPRVVGLVGLGITPVLDSATADPQQYMTSGELALLRRTYLTKLLKPSAWLRVLTLRTDFSLLRRSLAEWFRAKPGAAGPPTPAAADNSNPLFPPAFFAMAESRRPLLLVFGGADRLQWEFEEKFASRYRDRLNACASAHDIHVIANANHTLTFPEWQDEMRATMRRWLPARFPMLATVPAETVTA